MSQATATLKRTGELKRTRRRRFHPRVYAEIIERQDGFCACGCEEELGTDPRDIQFDHELALHLGGEDTPENLRALKKRHHLVKTIRETKDRAKFVRIAERAGLSKRRMNRQDQMLAKMLGASSG